MRRLNSGGRGRRGGGDIQFCTREVMDEGGPNYDSVRGKRLSAFSYCSLDGSQKPDEVMAIRICHPCASTLNMVGFTLHASK